MTKRATDKQLAAEAKRFDRLKKANKPPLGWVNVSEGAERPTHPAAVSISIRMPVNMLAILREFAEREGVGYQVLIKTWLHDRIREESKCLRK